jgi:TRAP-type C4-dicarboxylate transport system substrate-binding protein
MHNSSKITVAIAAAALAAVGATAFTATSTIDNAAKHVGATGQTISGVHVSNVAYTWDAATDGTSGVDFHTQEALGANDTMTVSLADGDTAVATAGVCTPTPNVGGGVDFACTWSTPVHNAQSLSIVVN